MSRTTQGSMQTGVQISHRRDWKNEGPDQLFSFLELTPTPSPSIDGVEWHREKYGLVDHSYPEARFTIKTIPDLPQFTSSSPFPEGGWRAWSTVLGGLMVVFCTLGAIQSFGVYQDYYTRVSLNEHTPSEISWIGSVQIFFLFVIGLPVGRLFDEGYFHHCVISGSLLYLLSAFLLSLSQPHHYYQHILSQGVGMGIGMGLMFLPAISVPAHYFRKRRSFAMGVVILGSSIGAVVYPILLNHLLYGPAGFSWGIRAVGFLDVCLLLGANLLMRTRLPAHRNKPKRPTTRKLLTDVAFMLYTAGTFLVFWGLFVPFFYLQLFTSLHGVAQTFQTYSIAIMNAASALGRIIPNLIADKYGTINGESIMIPCTTAAAGLIFALFAASTTPGVILFSIFYGFFSGAFLSLLMPAAASFANDVSEIGLRVGITCFVIAFPLLTGDPIAGVLLSPPHFTWWRPFTFATVSMLTGTLCLVISRSMLAKRKGTKTV